MENTIRRMPDERRYKSNDNWRWKQYTNRNSNQKWRWKNQPFAISLGLEVIPMSAEPIHVSYLSEKDIVYRKCTPEEFHRVTTNSMTTVLQAVCSALEKTEDADK